MATIVDQVPEPKHKVFLSHSGAQKDFVDQLCVDLERVSYIPFFDRRHASLEKGAIFPDRIFDAVRQCSLFVLVLSEDFFTNTKWPMLELAAAVKAQSENPKLKLLPLFFKISSPEFKVEERRANWFKCWTDWASETSRINVMKWKEALKVVEAWNGIEFLAGMGEVKYRKLIVETVCRICPNNMFDVSRVVGRERLCQIVSHKFEELKRETQCELKAPQIGVFGMGGLGKTTLCKVMCNHYFADFGGNVIHIDLRLNVPIVEHQKKVIGKLTGATQDELSAITDPDEGHPRLKTILSMHKVFLALDNVTDDSKILEEVLWYLSVSYGAGSMILVTSRSLEVLLSELQIKESHCLEVPDLNETEAISLFLQAPTNKHLELSCYSDDEQFRVVEGVHKALFKRELRAGEQFHPLALKVLASRLGKLINKPEQWRRTLAKLDLKFTKSKDHPIFSILGSSFEMLPKEQKLIFMDVALFKPSCAIVQEDVCKWLSLVHGLLYEDIEEHLRSLRTKSLLEEGLGDEESKPINIDEGATSIEASGIGGLRDMDLYSGPQVVVHDLYVEFAKLECKSDSLDKIQCFAHEDCDDVPRQMQGRPSAGFYWSLKRIALIRGSLSSLSECKLGKYYENVQVLRLEYLTTLTELDIKGMICLASIDILCCYKLRNIHGLQTLKRLAWLRVARCEMLEALPNLQDLSLLEHVEVRNSETEICPIISNCPKLYELRLSGHYGVKDLSTIQALNALRMVMIEWCPQLCTLPMLQDFRVLRELYVLDCPELGGVMEIGSLVALRKLHLRWIKITELGGVGLMRDLCELVCEQCPLLHKLSDKIGGLTNLMLLGLSHCPKLDGVLAVGSLLALQKLHLRSIAVTELNGVGKLRCLRELVWTCAQTSIPKLHVRWELSDVGELTELKVLNIQLCCKRSFTFENSRALRRMRNFLQGEVHCDIGDVNHVTQIMTEQAMMSGNAEDSRPTAVERRVWSFMTVQSTFDVVEEIELDNDVIVNANKIPQVTVKNVEFRTTLRFFYGVSLYHVNECVPSMGSPMRIVFFTEDMFQGPTKPDMSTLRFGNIGALYLDDLEIGHLQLIGMKCLSKLYIRRCKRLSRPVILEAMMALEDVKMVDCEYLDDDCIALRIRECAQLRVVILHKCFKVDFVFYSGMGYHGLQKLLLKDCPHVVDIDNSKVKDGFPELQELEVINCPLWRCRNLSVLGTIFPATGSQPVNQENVSKQLVNVGHYEKFSWSGMMATRVDQVPEPKHKVFLSHSGAQKDFVDQLCVNLERVSYIPFFDRRHASLEKGATFPDPIFDAVRQCSLFVLVLSEDFFIKTKWPMMELVEAVQTLSQNSKLKLLPLFFKISPSEFKLEKNRNDWSKCWTDWASANTRIDVKKCKEALKVVEVWNGIPFPAGMGEVEYRKLIVETICRICPNSVFDVSRVVGRERLCQIVSHKFDKLKRETQCDHKAPQIGVFGMGGLGKTTLCKVMCNHYFADFGGNVIHIDLRLNAIVEHQKKVIGKLTGATRDELSAITDPDEGHPRLETLLSMHKVFLALDNVTDDPKILEEVLWYLSRIYGVGSMILVTSRGLGVLRSKLQIGKSHCLEVPDLNETEAISLFLQAIPSNNQLQLSCYSDDEQLRVVEGAVFTRNLRSVEQFHPLGLKALASRLGKLINKPEQWRRTLATLDLKFTESKDHIIFSILGSSYEMLPEEVKLIFMDVALFKPSCVIVQEDVCKWLSLVHRLPYVVIQEHLSSLRMKSLLEEGLGDEETKPIIIDEGATSIEASGIGGHQGMDLYSGPQVVVHDLYAEFAKLECKSDSLDTIQCFAHEDCDDVPRQMQGFPSGGFCWPLKRIALVRGSLRSLSECRFGEYYKNVQVLRLEYLTTLTELDVEGMFCLASVDILCCYKLRNIHGLQTLKRLAWLRVARCEMLEALPNLQDLSLLEHVEVRNSRTEICPIISNCPKLYELRLSGHYGVKDLSTIQALNALRKVKIEWCPQLCTLPMLQDFRLLHELYVLDCPELGGVMEIGSLVALRKLHLRWTKITELGGVGLMRDLCELICEQCPLLHTLSDKIGGLTKLTLLRLS